MIKNLHIVIAACAVLFAASGLHATLRAQAQSAAAGVYTEAQAMRGATLYAEQCASCHGEDMSGVADLFPALVGDTFVTIWQERSVGELFEKISLTMPGLEPGSLMPEQTADLVADLLRASKYPAGATELGPEVEALKGITIGAPPQ
jgi:cytochrome c